MPEFMNANYFINISYIYSWSIDAIKFKQYPTINFDTLRIMTEQIENSINAIGMVTTIINTLTNVGDTIQKYSQQNIRQLLISLM